MQLAVLCIGRNIGGSPMDAMRWETFKGEACALVGLRGGTFINTADGTGYWQGESEDTYLITFTDADLDALQGDLPLLALQFEQEAIALIVGTSNLAYA